MTITPDLHPGDAAHRRDLVAELRALRIDACLSYADVASASYVHRTTGGHFERDEQCHHIVTVQRYTRAVGHVADLVLHGIVAPATANVRTYAAVAASSRDPEAVDAATRSLCIARLTAARRSCGLTRTALGTRMGITGDAVHRIEAERYEPLLSTYQRYARALGGWLTVELRPVMAKAAAYVERADARPGMNDTLPCGTRSARLRHLAQGRTCVTCRVGHELLPVVGPLERAEAA